VQVALAREAGGTPGRLQIGGAGGVGVAGQLEELGADGVVAVPGGDAGVASERIEQFQAGARAMHHGSGDGLVQRDDRVVGCLPQELVQGEDLRPVGGLGGRGFVVDGGDGRLQLVGAGSLAAQGAGDQLHAFGDRGGVPQCALVRPWDQLPAGAGARGAASVGEQHEGEQPGGFGVAGQQPVQKAGQPESLGGQVGAEQAGPEVAA
jgi:hypothetical protein